MKSVAARTIFSGIPYKVAAASAAAADGNKAFEVAEQNPCIT